MAVDDIICTEHYFKAPAWSLSVVHFQEPVNQDAVKTTLALKPAGEINKQAHYKAAKSSPFFELLAHVGISTPRPAGHGEKGWPCFARAFP